MESRPQFTKQQAAAILTRGVSIALSAGAGCGKTFVLTQRFLAGLEPAGDGSPVARAQAVADLHSLVAITFTDRAAREMRDRIRAACHQRLHSCPPEQVDHWLGILRGLDAARISTIHSFCTSLLRSQAVEAGLDPRFAVLEAALADTLLRHVVRDTLHELIEKEDDDAVRFVVKFGLERAREILRKLTIQRFQIDFGKFARLTPTELADEWRRRWNSEFVPMLINNLRSSSVVQRVLDSIAGSPSKHDKMRERIARLKAMLPTEASWRDPIEALKTIREDAKVQGGGGKKDWASDERQEEIKLAFAELREEIDELFKRLIFEEDDIEAAAEIACLALRLAEVMSLNYADAKKEHGVLDFDDLLLHARNLLRDNPSVCQRVAAGVRMLMVDEFQDTDPVQADLVRSLCGAALTRGKLFMVGDRKQSIYRFRRADPTVFSTMSNELPESGRLPLNVNFRSQPAVLNFVNQMFAAAMEGYERLEPFRREQISPTPAVEFLFAGFDARGADAVSQQGLRKKYDASDDDLRPNAAELRAREADWMGRRIFALLADPTPRIRTKGVDANGRPVLRRTEPGDIVVLFRALSNVQAYETALRRYGLNYYLVGGKAFFAQQEVFDLLNLCRYLDDCDDLVGLSGVLRSPFFNLSDDALQALAFHAPAMAPSDAAVQGAAASELVPTPRGLLKSNEESSSSAAVLKSLEAALRQEPTAASPTKEAVAISTKGRKGAKIDRRQQSLFDHDDEAEDSDPLAAPASPISVTRTATIETEAARSANSPPSPASRVTHTLHQTLYFDPPDFLPEDQRSRIRFAAETLRELRTIKDRIPLSELLTRAIERTGYDASLLVEFLGSRKLANLRKLVDMARQFDQSGFYALKDYVTRLQTSVLEETDEEFATTQPESGDVIRLMSIHQSKGLEFPVVIVADIDRKGPPRGADAVLHPELGALIKLPEQFGKRQDNLGLRMHDLLESDADDDETIRLFYVACTRAADYLILSTGFDEDKPAHSPWMQLVQSRFDINTGLLKDDALLGSSTAATAGRETIPDILVHRAPFDVKPAESPDERKLTPGQIPGQVLAAEAGEFPESARVFGRDATDLRVVSVSRLESVDAELLGNAVAHVPRDSRNDADEPVDLDLATSLGMIVHDVLERVDFRAPDNWRNELAKAVIQHAEQSSDSLADQAATMLSRFFASPIVEDFARAKSIYREIDFLLPWPRGNSARSTNGAVDAGSSLLIAGVVDLLIETETGWQILDYKTGEFPLSAPADRLLLPYELQLGLYARAVEQAFGVLPSELSLIVFRPQVRRITLPWSTARWDDIRMRVDRALWQLIDEGR